MNVAEWQKRLEDNFSVNGAVGGNLFEIFDLEQAYGEYFASTFHGQSVLIDSFQSFFVETLKSALRWVADRGWPKGLENYAPIFLYYLIMFRRFRACENLLLKGYPLDGYGLLRDLKDRAIFLAGIAHNITTLPRLFGYDSTKTLTGGDRKKIKRDRKHEEHLVLNRLVRKDSGLPPDIVKELELWEQLFDEEVHGAKLSFATELGDWVQRKASPSIGPAVNQSALTMYMNRATEIAWLLLRLFPYLQPEEEAFGAEWHRKHEILDDSFRYAQRGLSQLGKKIGDAFIVFVDEKFSFKRPFYYFEANGSA